MLKRVETYIDTFHHWYLRLLTDVQTPLFGGVLSGVPVLPVFQLIISALLLSEHHHHHTLSTNNTHSDFLMLSV